MFKVIKGIAKFFFLCLAPILLALVAVTCACADGITLLKLWFQGKATPPPVPQHYEPPQNASVVIPNWNGRDLLEKYLPALLEACSEGDEIIVVDNASSDGSAELLRREFPQVRLVQAERNLGFGSGCNLGARAARNRVVVMLNNDMQVTPDFLRALLAGFTDAGVFAVSAQIFFRDPAQRREETGLTAGSFDKGFLRVRHVSESDIHTLYPTFYAGGGSSAYDREKFLDLGGFDPLFEPFYLEDTDLSYCAWRRGWKMLYQPNSCVYHEHRATIGKHYSREAILAYLQKNYVLMVWKDIHHWRWLAGHFFYLYCHMVLTWMGAKTDTRTSIGAFLMALRKLPLALRCRSRALGRATVDDAAVFQRTRPSVFRDLFLQEAPTAHTAPATVSSSPRPLNILFVSPYSIYPPIHGGAVFMLEAIRAMAKKHNIYVLTFVDRQEEVGPNRTLEGMVRKVVVHVRRQRTSRPFGMRSHAEETFCDARFAELLEKLVFLYDIDVIQFEYAQLAQYRLPLRHTPQCLFEHDVHFRSVARQMISGHGGVFVKSREFLEWLRAMRFEINAVEQFDAIFTCHDEEKRLLESFLDGRRPPIFSDLRTVIDTSSYAYPGGPRKPDSLLFVGNFQHRPNVEGLTYFCREVLPLVRARRPSVTSHVVGAHAPEEIQSMLMAQDVDLLGQVPDIREPLYRYAVFVCPILTGAGMRVKILEAFASGIPVVSTPLGAEGIRGDHGTHFLLAGSAREFAEATLRLLENPEIALGMSHAARKLAETLYDANIAASKLGEIYRQLLARQKGPGSGIEIHAQASPLTVR